MASSLISGAVALLLILTGGYVIASGILSIAETSLNSQIEMNSIGENIRESSIRIDQGVVGVNGGDWWAVIDLNNTGSTTYGKGDFSKTDVFIFQDTGGKQLMQYSDILTSPCTSAVTPETDIMNTGMWDPSETLRIGINTSSVIPNWTRVVMPNGVTAASNL